MDWDVTRPEASLTSYLRSQNQLVPGQQAAPNDGSARVLDGSGEHRRYAQNVPPKVSPKVTTELTHTAVEGAPEARERSPLRTFSGALSNARFGAALGVVGAVDIAPSRLPGDVTASAYDRGERSCPAAGRRSSSALIEGPVTTV